MPEYLSPGVYVEEVPSGPRPIEGVSTSTAGMVGLTERGPTRSRLVTSWGDFQSWYGGVIDPATSFAPFAARGFFDNGGQRLFVARVTRADAVAASMTLATAGAQTVIVTATGPGDWGNRIFLRVQPGTLDDAADPLRRLLRVTLLYYRVAPPMPFVDPLDRANIANPDRRVPDIVEDYDNLGVLPTQSDFFIARVTSHSHLIEVAWGNPAIAPDVPNPTGAFVQLATVAGADGVAAIVAATFQGNFADPPDQRMGLAALAGIDQISILMAPDEGNTVAIPTVADRNAVTNGLIDQCELLRDRFAVLSLDAGIGDVADPTFTNTRDTSYAAVYYPWIRVLDPQTSITALSRRLVTSPASTRARTSSAACTRRRPTRWSAASSTATQRHPQAARVHDRQARAGHPEPAGHQRAARLPRGRRGIRVWGARTLSVRSAVELRQRPPAVHLHRGVDRRGHAVGRVRAERRAAVGPRAPVVTQLPDLRSGAAARCRARPQTRRSSSPATARR